MRSLKHCLLIGHINTKEACLSYICGRTRHGEIDLHSFKERPMKHPLHFKIIVRFSYRINYPSLFWPFLIFNQIFISFYRGLSIVQMRHMVDYRMTLPSTNILTKNMKIRYEMSIKLFYLLIL